MEDHPSNLPPRHSCEHDGDPTGVWEEDGLLHIHTEDVMLSNAVSCYSIPPGDDGIILVIRGQYDISDEFCPFPVFGPETGRSFVLTPNAANHVIQALLSTVHDLGHSWVLDQVKAHLTTLVQPEQDAGE